jgi:COP9 signalosome complex subunit 1
VQTNLIKESIRMGYNDFGDYYYAHGYLADAFKSYARTRDYCTTSKHVIHTCMSAILVSIEMGQFTHVTSYVSKAEQTAEALEPPTVSKLRCAAGLAHLEAKKYKLAARKVCFTCVPPMYSVQYEYCHYFFLSFNPCSILNPEFAAL